MENTNCLKCNGETIPSIWTGDIIVLHCEKCLLRHYYSKKLKRIMTDSEINRLQGDWK